MMTTMIKTSLSSSPLVCTQLAVLATLFFLASSQPSSVNGLPMIRSVPITAQRQQQQQQAQAQQQLLQQKQESTKRNLAILDDELFGKRLPELVALARNDKTLERALLDVLMSDRRPLLQARNLGGLQLISPGSALYTRLAAAAAQQQQLMQQTDQQTADPNSLVANGNYLADQLESAGDLATAQQQQADLIMQSLVNNKRNKAWRPCAHNAVSCFVGAAATM